MSTNEMQEIPFTHKKQWGCSSCQEWSDTKPDPDLCTCRCSQLTPSGSLTGGRVSLQCSACWGWSLHGQWDCRGSAVAAACGRAHEVLVQAAVLQ